MDDEARRTRRIAGPAPTDPTEATEGDQRQANAALEILLQLRRLRVLAEENDLSMILYLLDMVSLEAEDYLARSRASPETP